MTHLRIAYVCPCYYPVIGGVEYVVQKLAESASKMGHDVTVYTTRDLSLPKEDKVNGVYVKRFLAFSPNHAYHLCSPNLFWDMNLRDFDVVHGHSVNSFPTVFAAIATQCSLPFILSPHYHAIRGTAFRNFVFKMFSPAVSLALKRANRVVAVSKFEKKELQSDFPSSSSKCIVISIGADEKELRGHVWNPNDQRLILYVGRLEKLKNVDLLIYSFHLLRKKYPDYVLEIVGQGSYSAKLKEIAQKLEPQNITFTDFLSGTEYFEKLERCHLFVSLSEMEAYGITVSEAILIGVPTLVAEVGGLGEFVSNGLTYGVSPPLTPEKIASRMAECLSVGLPARQSNDSQNKIWTVRDMTERMISLYEEVIDS